MTTPPPTSLQFRVLGPLEVLDADAHPLELGSPKVRALLSVLLIEPGRVVPLDRICHQLWGDDPPAAATGTLQAYVSQLRRGLEPGRKPHERAEVLVTRPPGYALAVEPAQVDATRFENLVHGAGELLAAGRPERAEADLRAARALWRGRPFAEVAEEPFARATVVRLEQLRLLALEREVDVLLATDRTGPAVVECEALVRDHPLRERFWAQLVEALYRSGRQADALRTYQGFRTLLAEEMGLEPGPELQRLERAVLAHDPALLPAGAARVGAGGAAPAPDPADPAPPAAPASQAPPASPGVSTGAPAAAADGPGQALVGREGERRVLADAVAAARRGRGRVVVIEGEAGIGKTRLAEAALDLARAEGLRTAWSACLDRIGAPPLWPWREVLKELTGLPAPDPEVLPDAGVDQAAARFRVLVQVVDGLVASLPAGPALVVVDDLQWADAASLQLLRVLVHRIANLPLVVVATARRPDAADLTQLDETLADLGRSRETTRLPLRGLSEADVATLVGELIGRDGRALAPALHDRTGGNPFFCSELVKLLESEARLGPGTTSAAVGGAMPPTVREVVDRRVARLPDDTRTMLRLAAVAGASVELAVLEHCSGLDAERVAELLEPAVLTGLLLEVTDGLGWRFPHAIVQDAVRASLSRVQQARLHAAVAAAIESVHHTHLALHLDELALHSWAGARVTGAAAALRWAVEAAEAARDAFGYDRAALHFGRALELADLVDAPGEQRLALLVEVGQALRLAGDVEGARQRLLEAITLAERIGDLDTLSRAVAVFGGVTLWNWNDYGRIDDAVVATLERLLAGPLEEHRRAELLGTLAVELYYGPRRGDGVALARDAVARARDLGDAGLRARTLNNLAIASWEPAHDPERRLVLEEALAIPGVPLHAEAIARIHRASMALRHGELDVVEDDLARCLSLAGQLGVPEIAAQVTYARGGLAMLRGDWDLAEHLAEEAFEGQQRTNLWGAAWCRHVQLAVIRSAQGRLAEVVDDMVAQADEPGMQALRCSAVAGLAEVGDHAGARLLAERWFPLDPGPDWSWDFRVTAWAAAAARLGYPDREAAYERLLPFAGRLVVGGTSVACRGSTGLVLGRLAAAMGRTEEARAHWEQGRDQNHALGAHWWAERCEAELAQLG